MIAIYGCKASGRAQMGSSTVLNINLIFPIAIYSKKKRLCEGRKCLDFYCNRRTIGADFEWSFFPPPFVLVENCAAPSDNASGSWILMGPLRMMNKWEILIKGGTFVCCCRLSRAQHKSQFLCRGDGKQAHILGERGSTREKVLSRKSNGSKKSIHAVRMGGHRRLKLNCVRGRNESFFVLLCFPVTP